MNRICCFCEIHWFVAFHKHSRASPPGLMDGICQKLYIRINGAPNVLCLNYTAVQRIYGIYRDVTCQKLEMMPLGRLAHSDDTSIYSVHPSKHHHK